MNKFKKQLPFDPYMLIPFIIVVFLIAKFIFGTNYIPWLLNALRAFLYACIIIYLLSPIVNFIKTKTKLGHKLSVVLAFLIVFSFIAFFIMLIVPGIKSSVDTFTNNIDAYTQQINDGIEWIEDKGWMTDEEINEFVVNLQDSLVSFSSNLLNVFTRAISSVTSLIGNIALIFLAFFMAFYALRDTTEIKSRIYQFIRTFTPIKHANRVIKVLDITDVSIKKFLLGKLYTCFILGLLVTVSIPIVNAIFPLNIPYASLMGFIIGITNLIPYIGPIFGTIPCILIAIFSGFGEAVALLAIILVMQQIDNIVISPKVLGQSVGLKPFWIVASVTIGGGLFGGTGMILAVPIASVIQILVTEKMNNTTNASKQ